MSSKLSFWILWKHDKESASSTYKTDRMVFSDVSNDDKDARMCIKLDGTYSEGDNSHYS